MLGFSTNFVPHPNGGQLGSYTRGPGRCPPSSIQTLRKMLRTRLPTASRSLPSNIDIMCRVSLPLGQQRAAQPCSPDSLLVAASHSIKARCAKSCAHTCSLLAAVAWKLATACPTMWTPLVQPSHGLAGSA